MASISEFVLTYSIRTFEESVKHAYDLWTIKIEYAMTVTEENA